MKVGALTCGGGALHLSGRRAEDASQQGVRVWEGDEFSGPSPRPQLEGGNSVLQLPRRRSAGFPRVRESTLRGGRCECTLLPGGGRCCRVTMEANLAPSWALVS